MCSRRLPMLMLILILSFAAGLSARTQTLYSYQELSHLYYGKQKDSLKKAWVCPAVYSDKATQKKYREIWDERTEFLTGAIANDNYVRDREVYDYIEGIISQLVRANKQMIPAEPFLLIDRSASVNAYAIGGNIIAVNLGLISFAHTREELALAIAHELSHNILSHPENAMRQRAEWLSSEEYRNSLNAVLDSKYERLTRLRKVLEGYTFSRSKHQRYKESEADSLAVILLRKSNIPFDARYFLHLDSSDIQYRQALKQPVKFYFAAYQLSVEDAWTQKRSRGLSSKSYNFRDTTGIEDSVKTHPDCAERYARTKGFSTPGAPITPIPAAIQEKTAKMLIWNIYNTMTLTPCLYRILLEKDKGRTDPWYDFMINNILTGLYYSDKELHRFSAIGVKPKEYISRDYYELQNLLEQIPREKLEQYCQAFQREDFWKSLPPAEKALKNLIYTLAFDTDNSDKGRARAAKEFSSNNSGSMYCEFADNFVKK